jgi:NADH-quinone oxidoreductase subunit H
MSFALFFLAEYSNIILMCSMTVILFLGGWFPILNLEMKQKWNWRMKL